MKNRVEAKLGSLVMMLTSVLAASAPAQTFSVLHNFTGSPDDGADPPRHARGGGGLAVWNDGPRWRRT
jgi:hypothetical protein